MGAASRRPARPRVVFLDHVARLSGGEIALLRLVPALHVHVDVVVVLGEDGPLVPLLRDAGAQVVVLPLSPDVRDRRRGDVRVGASSLGAAKQTVAYILRLRRLLRELSPDLVHTNSLKAAVYGGAAGRLARIPVLWHVRDRIAPDYLPSLAVHAVRLLARFLPSAIVANSHTTLATVPSRLRSARSGVVPDSAPAVPSRQGSGATGPLVFGVVGRLSPWKGQDVFLRAFAAAFAGSPHRAQLVGAAMFGEGDYEVRLRRLVGQLGITAQVEFRGFQADMDAAFLTMDVLVHCSTLPEPFGQVVVEGLAHGLPVIATSAGGPAEIVTDGVDGILVPAGDPIVLAAAMRRLGEDAELRRRLGTAGVRTATAYTPERSVAALLPMYARLGLRVRPLA